MASRYWVGGAGNWDIASTTHWAASSGGASGASNPTSSDDVFFDANSGSGIVNVTNLAAACRNLDFTGYTGTFSFGNQLNINPTAGGTIKFVAGMSISGSTVPFITAASGALAQLTTAGKSLPGLTLVSTGGGVQLQDALTLSLGSSVLTLTSGTLDTNGFDVACGRFVSNNSNTRTLTLGATTMSLSSNGGQGSYAWDTTVTTGMTFNQGTSTVKFVFAGDMFMNANGLSFYNVTRAATTPSGADTLGVVTPFTCTGTFTCSSDNATSHRLLIFGSNTLNISILSQRTITAAAVSLTNTDFSSIAGAGAATWSGTSLGDAQGNSGITFTTPVTRYAVVAGNFSSTATWSTTSGGSGGASVPICHDTIIMDANAAAGTYNVDMARLGTINCTGFTRTLNSGSTIRWFGDITLGSGMTFTLTGSNSFCGRGSQTVTSAGKTWGGVVQILAINGSYTLQDDLTTTGSSFRHVGGTLNLNGKRITAPLFLSQVATQDVAPTINFGGGTMTLNGTGSVWNVNVVITTTGGGTVEITDTSSTAKTFAGNGNVYGFTLKHAASGTAQLTISGSNTFGGLDFECSSARIVQMPGPATTTVNGPVFLQGGTVGNELTIKSSSLGNTANVRLQGGGNRVNGADIIQSSDLLFRTPSEGFFAAALAGH